MGPTGALDKRRGKRANQGAFQVVSPRRADSGNLRGEIGGAVGGGATTTGDQVKEESVNGAPASNTNANAEE